MFCWKCGKEIPDESLFCSYCGAETKNRGNKDGEPIQKKQQDYRAFVAIGLIILLLLAAATILIGALSNREKADTAAETPVPAEGSPTAAESPAPAETPAPAESPEPTETSRPRFISPEQYARENGLDWPADGSDAWGDKRNIESEGNKAWNTSINAAKSWDERINYDEVFSYADAYIQARAEGKSDLEAHEIGLEETGIDRRILGKEEYVQYIYDSAISAGVSEYDAEEFMEQEKLTWDAAWNVYKYARDTGNSHEQAVGSVDWRCFSNINTESSSLERKQKYIEAGMSSAEAEELVYGEERDKLYSCLQYWYEIKREDIIK